MENSAKRKLSGITFRALVVGLVLVVANTYWLTIASELMWPRCLLNFVSLFFNAVFTLFVLTVLNKLLKWASPRSAFTPQELLVIYIMVVMVSTFGGHTMMCYLIGAIAHPYRFASPENEWADLFWRYIPQWFTPSVDVLDDYFDGESTFYTVAHLRGWIVPIVVWTVFISVIWFVLLCINSLIRAQWTEKEKLAYPIIQLPLRMTSEDKPSFFRNKSMWLGFGIAGLFEILAGLHYLFPKVPAVQLNYYYIGHLFTGRPWNRIGHVMLSAYPFIIGLVFFVPLDISLSAWVFYLVGRAERVVRLGMLGHGRIYFDERAAGAWLAVGILALWGTRRQFQQVWRRFLGKADSVDDSREPMRHRTAVFGIIIGMIFLFIFSYKAGMTFWPIAGFLGIFIIMSIGVTRVRAEFGPPAHEILWVDPARILAVSFGPRGVGASNLTILSFYFWLNRLYVSNPMPNQLEAFKLAERTKINSRRLVLPIMLATVVGALASFWAYLHVLYSEGASSVPGSVVDIGWETFERLENWLSSATGPDPKAIRSIGIAASITFILYFLRHAFFWWPFHPIGYVMTSATWGGLADIWFSVFLGWLVKVIVIKFFGLRAHRRAVPFFLGLILGDYVVASGWSLIGTIFRIPTYVLWSP